MAVEVSHAEKTKSESPELRLSVHEIAPLDHAEHRARENDTSLHEPVILEEQLGEMVPQSSQSHRDPVTKDSGQGFQLESPSERIQKPQVPQTLKSFSPATAWRGSYKSPPVARRTAYNVYDPIESDSEGFQEKQRMFHAKRLEVSKTPARNVALPQVNFEGSDHNKPHTGGAPCLQKLQSNSLGEHPRSPSVSRIIPPWEFVQQLIEAAAEDGNQLLSVQDPSPVIFESGAVDPSATHAVTGYKAVSPVNSRRSPKIDAQPEEPSISQKRPLYDMAVGQHPPFEIYIDPLEKAPPNGAKPLPTGDRTSGHRGVVKIHQQNADVHHHKNKPPPQPVERKSGVKQRNKMAQLDAQSAEVKSKTPPITHSMIELPRNAKEEEDKDSTQDFSNARSIVEGEALPHLNEERPRQPRTPSMAIPKSKKLKEQQLVEQAEKMMIAADGAKQLEAEKSKLKKTAPKKRIIPSIPAEVQKTSPRTPAQQTARKMSEQQQAAAIKFRQERFSSVLSGDSTTTKSCIAYNERRSSQVRSSSPANRENFSDRKRRTLTPLLPGSASSNLKSGNGIRSSPLSAKSSSSMGRPLRSAMKQPASALRRSVSQVSFGGSQIAPEAISSNHPILPVTRGQVVEPSVSEGSPSVMAAHKTLNTNKIQSKLNVTRDTKLKGRVNDPPNPAKPAPNKEHVISSDDDEDSASSYASREDVGYGVAKAGPSSKTKSMSGTTSTTNLSVSTSEVISSSIGPELQALKKGEGGMRSSTSAEASRPASASRPQTKSISRKPAEASETMSVTSSPSSESEDSSDDAQDTNASQLKMKPNTSNAAATLPPIEPALASQSSQISSTSKSTTDASASSGADASNQLHRETQAAAAPRGKRYSMKLRPDGRLLNGIRPANFRYPSLSQLKREAEGRNIRSSTSLANGASQKQTQMVADLDMSSESSDEDSVSDSSDGESEAKRKSHSGFVPGMKGLLKRMFSSQIFRQDCETHPCAVISGANTGKT